QPPARRRGAVSLPVDGRSGARAGRDRGRLRATLPPRAPARRRALRRLSRGDPGPGACPHMTTRGVAGVRERLERSLERWQEPGATELCEGVAELLGDAARAGERLHIERLKPAVYRLKVGEAPGRALVLKRHPPAVAQADRLVAERWLPAIDLADGCPQLLTAVAEREGCWVWHVYEDLGDGNLAGERQPWRLDAAVDAAARRPLAQERLRLHDAHGPAGPAHRLGSRRCRAGELRRLHLPLSVGAGRAASGSAALPRSGRAHGLAPSRRRDAERAVSHDGVRALRPLRRVGGYGPAARRRRVGHRRADGFRALVPGAPP